MDDRKLDSLDRVVGGNFEMFEALADGGRVKGRWLDRVAGWIPGSTRFWVAAALVCWSAYGCLCFWRHDG